MEIGVHTVRAWTQRHHASHGKVLLKLDFANAFNRVCRQTALTRTAFTFPGIARWVTWCYQHPSALRFGAAAIQSAGGVQQGDPLGPLLFATAIHTLTQELRAGPLDLALFYLDDGIAAGDVAAVGAALAHIRTRGSELGLTLNFSKCEVVGVGGVQPDDLTDHFPAELLQHANGSSRLQRNFKFLGAAIGDDGFVQAHTQGRVDAVRPLLEALSALGDAQVGVRLLRTCASFGRVLHSMRCNPPHYQLTAIQQFDSVVQVAFSSITGFHLTAQQYEQAARSLSLTGLGLRSSAVDCPAAYLASVGGTAIACEELDSAYVAAAVVLAPAVTQATAALNTRLQHPLAPGAALSMKQNALAKLLDEASWHAQLATTSPTAKALLHSEGEPGARAFLATKPGGVTHMDSAIFVTELRHHLGVPEATAMASLTLCFCTPVHTWPVGKKTLRHTAMRNAICKWVDRAGLQPDKERASLLLPQRPEDTGAEHRRPADIYLPSLHDSP